MGVIWTPEAVDKTKRSGLVLSRQNILTRGLIAGIVGGHPFDVVRGDGLVNSGAERVASQNGSAWSLASGEYLDSGNSGISVAPGAKWSAMVLVRSTSSTYSGQYAVCINYNGSSVALALTLGTSAAATGAAIFDGGYWRSSGVATPVYGDGRYHVILGVRNGPDLHYYVDGRLDSSYTMPSEASPGTSTTAITWGQYKNDGTNTTMVGELALGFVWSGVALTASDAKSLASDSWQLFEAENDPVFYTLAGGGTTVAVPAGALTLTGFAPTVTAGGTASTSVPAGAVTLTAYAPTVTAGGTASTSVPLGTVTLTGYAPTVTVGGAASIDVPLGTVALTGYAPTVTTGGQAQIDVPLGAVTLTGYVPTVTTTEHVYIAVPTAAMTLAAYVPTVTTSGTPDTWTPVSASTGTWTPASAAGGTWTPQ